MDLDNLCSWASHWQMKFNVSKCKVVHYGNGNMGYSYSMEGLPVEEVDCEKDLGVTFTSDLKSSAHCKDVYSKANRMLGLLSRTVKYKNPAVLTTLYKSIVRPHLEYCSTTWNPHYSKDKCLLERMYSIASHGCFHTSDHYLMKTGYVSWDCGLWRKEGTEPT